MTSDRFEALLSRYYAAAVRAAGNCRNTFRSAVCDAEDAAQHAAIVLHRRWAAGELAEMSDREFGTLYCRKAQRYMGTLKAKLHSSKRSAARTEYVGEVELADRIQSDLVEASDLVEYVQATCSDESWIVVGVMAGKSRRDLSEEHGCTIARVRKGMQAIRDCVAAAVA